MITHFKSALNKVEADAEMLRETENHLRMALEQPKKSKIFDLHQRRMVKMKKVLVASIIAVFALGISVGGYAFLTTPVAYVSLDINPSVELGVNALNNVVTAEGINEDGINLLEGQNFKNKKLADVLEDLIDSAADKDYLNDDGTSVVSITAESDNEVKANGLSDMSEQAVIDAISRNEFSAVVFKNCSDLSLRTEAKELGISPGKLKMIKSLQALDPTITVEQYLDAKVSDIMLKANSLINGLDAEDEEDELQESQKEAIEDFKDTAKETYERAKDSALAEFEESKEIAKAAFEDVKEQAENIKEEAKEKAEELKKQAEELVKNLEGLTEEEKAALRAQAEELRKQAEDLIKTAEMQAEELKDAAERLKDEAIETAEMIKDSIVSDDDEDMDDDDDEDIDDDDDEDIDDDDDEDIDDDDDEDIDDDDFEEGTDDL